jgi:hypothetical protein
MLDRRGLTCASITKGLDCQTALRDGIGPQRISGAVSNHHQRRRQESPQNPIYVVPQNQAQTMSANTESKTAPKVINGRINGRFAPGYSRNPGGSPEATRRAFNRRFLLDLAEDWQQHGREVFKRVRRESPAAYLKVCAMLVPRELQVEHSGGVKDMTDEQLERGIALIKEMLAQREAGPLQKSLKRSGASMRCSRLYAKTLPKCCLESAMNSMLAHRKNAVCHKSC